MKEKENIPAESNPNPNPPRMTKEEQRKKEAAERRRIKREKMKTWSPQKIAFERRRMAGYRYYLKKRRARIATKKKKEAKEKEKERIKKQKIREKERAKREKLKHKRRVGRPRKPGPKKKWRPKKIVEKKRPGRKKLPPYIYQIVECLNGVQKGKIAKFRTIEDAYEKFNELKAMDEKVIFPAKITGDLYLKNSNYEYLLLEKITDPDELGKSSILRNEFGKLVEQRTNNEEWRILDKFQYKKEETFYMYGMKPTSWKERKTFDWIYANKVINGIENWLRHQYHSSSTTISIVIYFFMWIFTIFSNVMNFYIDEIFFYCSFNDRSS